MSDEPAPRGFRWQALFQRATEAMFVLDRRRRLLFINRAAEQLTGLPLERARGLVCRRPRPVGPDDPAEDLLAHVLTPPPEALHGEFARARRLFVARSRPEPGPPQWWDVEFFPLRQAGPREGYLLVGRLLPRPAETPSAAPVLPERLESLRLRRASRFTFDLLAGAGAAMQRLAEQARLASQVAVPALLVGERGAGKRMLARVIHAQGPAREAPSPLSIVADCPRRRWPTCCSRSGRVPAGRAWGRSTSPSRPCCRATCNSASANGSRRPRRGADRG
jgi:hypothetical protein